MLIPKRPDGWRHPSENLAHGLQLAPGQRGVAFADTELFWAPKGIGKSAEIRTDSHE